MNYQRLLSGWFIYLYIRFGTCKLCERPSYATEDGSENVTDTGIDSTTPTDVDNTFSCPQPDDPKDFTECCWDPRLQCCPVPHIVHQMDDQLVMIVGLVVINTCLFLTVLIVVCCFWSHCPLYNTCRINYSQGDIIAYSKEDDPLNSMPPEDKDGQHHYSPNSVKIKPVEDV
ncbi:uncharacterized protein LOC124170784 [Ischnura elegans]|uniref:uncharacterized protein LOC124170784 n=1 Tax=Ischnura elegans TaxID=197161 RepID=UPI001ED89802|nr:uncharacterized protein LOC124170784 [Ischnura elegans]